MSTDIKPASALKKNNTSKAKESIIVRLSRGRSLKITFRPRIRVAKLLVKLLAIATGLFTSVIGTNAYADIATNALPTGGQVVYGNSTIQQTGNALNINQASQKTIINWQTFDIGAQASVNFYQPNASAIALNRVLGDNASQIFGKLNANGQVFLLNPHGTLFAPNAQVNVGGLLNSTMQMTDENFINSNYSLTNAGNGILDNQGTIYAQSIVFAGNDINNSGNLIATNVSLVAGNTVAVDLSGDGLIRARVQNPAVQAHITNSGLIDAVQQVTMSAGQVKDTLNSVVNNTGIVRATGLVNEGGIISLQAGKTLNSGSLDASSATDLGGRVAMLGEHVGVTGTGSIDVSGKTGGGTILVGGDFQGKNAEIQNASRTFFGKHASLNANATETGDGGKIIVWADDVTRGYGNISARGGDMSGNGGFVEVSGKRSLDYQAMTDTRAPNGNIGTLLLDPDFINISSISVNAGLADVDQFADPSGFAIIDPTTLNNALSNITLQANEDISFDEAVSINAAGVGITAQAGGFVLVQAPITTNGGVVSLIAGDPGSLTSPNEGALVVFANIDTTRGGVAPNGANILLESNLSDVGGNSIQLSANLNVGSLGDIIITDNGGRTNQTSGILTGNKLDILATHNVTLNGANQLNEVEIETTNSLPTTISNIQFNNTRNLEITGLSVTPGGGDGGSISVTNAGNIVQNGDISTHNGNINISTTGTNRDITIGAVINTGTLGNTTTINSTGDILATASGLVNSGAGDGNFNLSATGDIGSSPGQAVIVSPGAGNVTLTAGGNIAVHQIGSALDISKYTVTAFANQAQVQLSSVGNLNVNASLAFSSAFNTQDDNLSFTSVNGNVNISDNISIEANSVVLSSSSGNVNIGSGTGTLDLTIAQDNGVAIAAGNAININNGLTRNQNGNDRIFLSSGNLAGAGSISTSKLVIQSTGAVNLTGVHQVSQLAAEVINAGAGFNFLNNSASLEIFSDGSISGITTNNGAASITNQGGSISVDAGIDLGNADLTLATTSSTGSLNINDTIDAHNVTLGSQLGPIIVGQKITALGNVGIESTSGSISIIGGSSVIDSAGNITIDAASDVFIDGDITHTASATHTLAISAGNNITIQGGSDFTSPDAAMTVTITSDSDSTDLGRILLNNDTSDGGVDILSNGGNITLTGGTGFASSGIESGVKLASGTMLNANGGNIVINGITEASNSVSGVEIINSSVMTNGTGTIDITGFAIVADTDTHGVDIATDSRIESFDGKITIIGDTSDSLSSSNSNGVYIRSGSLVLTDGAGDIEVIGTSAFEGTNQSGIAIEGLTSPLILQTEIDTHGTGNIILTGTSNGIGIDSNGIKMSVGAIVEAEGTGNITMTGQANNFDAPGLAVGTSSLIKNFQGGDLDIRAGNSDTSPGGANHIELAGSSIQGSSGSLMFLRNLTTQPDVGIGVGGDGSTLGAFNLSDNDLAAITGFDTLTIGDTAHTGPFTVASLASFSSTNQQLNLLSNSTLINFTTPTSINSSLFVNANAGDVTLNTITSNSRVNVLANNNITALLGTNITAGVQGAEFKATTGNITLSSVNTSGDVKAVANGNITINTGAQIQADKILLAAQTGNFINNAGVNALLATNHWTVVSQDPSQDIKGGLVYNYKQYNTTYDAVNNVFSQPIQGSGDGFVYALAPSLTTTLTGNPDDVSKVYDATTFADLGQLTSSNFNASGLVDSDLISNFTAAALSYSDPNAGTGKTVQATSVSLAITDSTGANVYGYANQNISAIAGAIGEITKADAIVTAASNTVAYNGATQSVTGFTASGLVGGETESVLTGVSGTGGSGQNAGTYAHVLSGTDTNYNLTFVDGALTINKVNATVTAASDTVTYNGTTQSVTGFTASGLVGGETVSVLTGVSGTGGSGQNAGTYAHILSGTDTNYNLTFVDGALTINKVNATVTAASDTVTYNGATQSVTGFTASGLVGGETESVLTGVSGTGGSGRNAGTYAHTLSGTDTNYNLTFVDGSLTIDQAILNLFAVSDSRVYDGTTNSSGVVEKSGLQSGDTISGLSQVFDSKNAGLRTINVSSGYTINDGNGGANYLVMTNSSSGDITPAPLIVSAQGVNKVFDGTTVAQVTLSDNRIAGDNLTITNSSANFADAEVGTNKQIDVLGIAIDGGIDAGNYELQNTDTIAFADIFNEDGTQEANLTETNVIDSTQNLELALAPIQVKILNPDGSESAINVDVPKGKVLTCK